MPSKHREEENVRRSSSCRQPSTRRDKTRRTKENSRDNKHGWLLGRTKKKKERGCSIRRRKDLLQSNFKKIITNSLTKLIAKELKNGLLEKLVFKTQWEGWQTLFLRKTT